MTKDELYNSYSFLYNSLCDLGYYARFGQNTFSKRANDIGVSSYLRERMMNAGAYKGFGISAQSMSRNGVSYNIGKLKKSFNDLLAMKSYDEECLKVGFLSTDGYQALSKDHDKNFSITGIYNTQKDIVAELIQKKEIYTESYKQHLAKQFKDLFKDESIINRLIIGNYDTVEDIHKRPMAKFTQDIARQLNLIK